MFSDNFSEKWDSTGNQDEFIKNYFRKAKVPKKVKTSSQVDNFHSSQTSKNSDEKPDKEEGGKSFASISTQDKRTLDETVTSSNNKKIKKSKSSLQDPTSHENYPDIGFDSQKSKKKRKKCKKKKKASFEQQSLPDRNPEYGTCTEKTSSELSSHTMSAFPNDSSLAKSSAGQSKFYQKLQISKFRYLNEMLYTTRGKEALSYFQQNEDEFQDYHVGYQSQVAKWPIDPVNIIIRGIRDMNEQIVIADLGCGEAKIAETFPNMTVHSFDLIATKDCVTACDIAKVPLPNSSVDMAVFCLSLMGTNWIEYIKESHRILKTDGTLKIAEIESRIDEIKLFIKKIESYGFSLENDNLSHKMFIFLDFVKVKKRKNFKVKEITLKPCLYKKR